MSWMKNWWFGKKAETEKTEEPLKEEVLQEESLVEESLTVDNPPSSSEEGEKESVTAADAKAEGEVETAVAAETETAAESKAEAVEESEAEAELPAGAKAGSTVETESETEKDEAESAEAAAGAEAVEEKDSEAEALEEPEAAPAASDGAENAASDGAENAAETPVEAAAAEVPAEEVKPAPEAPHTSSADLLALEPADVFGYFRAISAIPHGSFHTEALSDYLEGFAREHGLEYVRDETGNLIISRPGSAGCEAAAPIALQGHIDMVCEKEASNPINMEQEAITLRTDGEWLWADRTTLGGDDGIAVAMMLALLADKNIKCPPLECIFTVDEEVGILGAHALDLSCLKSRRMINLDSEREGTIIAACAGGAEEVCTLFGRRREKKGQVLEITISGLLGGHSGEHIGSGRANADLLLARLLYRLEAYGKYCLISFNGGMRDNAIPRDARAEILFTGKVKRKEVKTAVASFAHDIKKEYSVTDPEIRIRATWTNKGEEELRIAFTAKDSRRMIRFLMALPNGLIEYSPLFKSVPQTSLSLGIVKTMADGMQTHSLVRSSVNSQKQLLMDKICCIAEAYGAMVETHGAYPAWELIEKSAFRDLAARVYKDSTGVDATVLVTHGGLECGVLASKVDGLDCISIGPDMKEIHTPSEHLHIPSTARTYKFLCALLAACAEG